jgi:hypothetical protein
MDKRDGATTSSKELMRSSIRVRIKEKSLLKVARTKVVRWIIPED